MGVYPSEENRWLLYAQHYLRRIQQGHFAGMEYMTRHVDMRLNPHLLHPGLQTIVSVALNYMPASRQPAVCLYAQGQDYHEVMRERLHLLMESLGAHGRCFVDTAPVMERYWAWRSGVGHFCRNGLISVSGYGPTVFLGELFLEESADHYGEPLPSSHPLQQGWQELCPALTPFGLDARLCLNYWTIEHRGELPPSIRLTDCLYGCDRCMRASEKYAWIGVLIVGVWQAVAMNTIIYISGLQTVPEEVYEASMLDGASSWKQFWKVTFPLVMPFVTINLVLSTKNFLMVFDQIMSLTKGGPAQSTESISYLIYRNGMDGGQFGFQSANAVIFFVVIVAISLFQMVVMNKKEEQL